MSRDPPAQGRENGGQKLTLGPLDADGIIRENKIIGQDLERRLISFTQPGNRAWEKKKKKDEFSNIKVLLQVWQRKQETSNFVQPVNKLVFNL